MNFITISGVNFFFNKRALMSHKVLKNGTWQFTIKLVNFKLWWPFLLTKSSAFSLFHEDNKKSTYKKRHDETQAEFLLGMKDDFSNLYEEQWSFTKNWLAMIAIIITTIGLILN